MFVKHARRKQPYWLLRLSYRIARPLFRLLPAKSRLAFLLDLEWIAARFAHEESFHFFPRNAHPLFLQTCTFISKHLPTPSRILDLGCGHGDISYLLARAGHRVTGVDYNAAHLEAARQRCAELPLADFFLEDARHYLKRSGEKFDLLVLCQVLEHLDNPEELLRSLGNDIRQIYIEVLDFDASYLNGFRVASGAKLTYSDSDHLIEFDRDELFRVITASGLRVTHCEFRYGMIQAWCETATT